MNAPKILLLVLAAAFAAAPYAEAAGGCGIGYHRAFGRCFRNESAPVVAPHATVVAPGIVTCPIGYHRGPHGQRCFRN